ncbi:putative IQ motif and ankyrin repeat domain-containing protein isoform X3 [Acanthaster planci]|uniref:IQ motif and ankyrin repeat domain-containing protein isoform X3 n=1 Tax=Acanthaster planci TaxID=133434 RepID=A0A8B7YAY5_ACAPL|nr:putative IQ motif and ankyrin repeat domain-containing protein isoform X3 [Acanthaster planci]
MVLSLLQVHVAGAKTPSRPAGKTAPPPKTGTQKNAAPAKPKPPSKETLAAVVIQKWVRRFLGRCRLLKLRHEKEEYEALMEKLEKEAFVAMVKREQERAEEEHRKEMEERRRRKMHQQRIKRILEAAFDGDDDEILIVLKEVEKQDMELGIGMDPMGQALRAKHQLQMVDCEDANNNTPLSEAASGGHADTIKLLIDRGADVNARGQFERTPLYRAAFAGHLTAAQVLLQHGADPRLYASDGATPEQVSANEPLTVLLQEWDVGLTDAMLSKMEAQREQRKQEERQRREAEMAKLENQLADAQKDHDTRQLQLNKAYCELNKRIEEHDKCTAKSMKTDITLQVVKDAEQDLEIAKLEAEKARERLANVKLQIREQQKTAKGLDGEPEVGVKANIKELHDVLMRDVGDKIKSDGRWPLLIDPSGRASTFLRYQDTNLLNALNPNHMQPEVIRMAVLGAIRFGKPLVLDMLEVDMFETCTDRFNEVHVGLMEDILSKELIKNEKYVYLIKDCDGPEYSKNNFNDQRTQQFKFVIVTKIEPADSLLERTYPIRIVVG